MARNLVSLFAHEAVALLALLDVRRDFHSPMRQRVLYMAVTYISDHPYISDAY